jgi:uncharacterized membrane protein YczE
MAINRRRVWLGALVGGVVFNVWSMVVEFALSPVIVGGKAQMDLAMANGWFLKEPRMSTGLFFLIWVFSLFIISYGLAWGYAAMRATTGAGPGTAFKLGLVVAFAAAFPMNFAHAVFDALTVGFWVMWMIEIGVGTILAALAAGWVYQDAPAS